MATKICSQQCVREYDVNEGKFTGLDIKARYFTFTLSQRNTCCTFENSIVDRKMDLINECLHTSTRALYAAHYEHQVPLATIKS